MTYKLLEENLEEISAKCKELGLTPEQSAEFNEFVQTLVGGIMERYEREMNYAVKLWNEDSPHAKKMTLIATANHSIGQHYVTPILIHTGMEAPPNTYINPAEHIPDYPH